MTTTRGGEEGEARGRGGVTVEDVEEEGVRGARVGVFGEGRSTALVWSSPPCRVIERE